MPRNVLQPPTLPLPAPFTHLQLSFSLRAATLLVPSSPSSALLPPRFSRPSGSLPSWRCSIEIQFPPAHPSHLPTLSPFPPPRSFSTSPTKPPPPPFGRPSAPRERKPPAAFRAINYVAQLFTGISRRHCLSDYPAPPVPTGRYPARRDVNTKTGDFKWPA